MTSRDRWRRAPAAMVTALAAGGMALHVASLWGPVDAVAARHVVDDTFYYLQVAWNHVHRGVPSMDGVEPTNGVQLLWYLALLPLAAVAPGREALLLAALGACAALAAVAVALAFVAGRALRDERTGVTLAALVAWLVQRQAMFLSGLESAIYLVTVLLVVTAYAQLLRAPTPGRLTIFTAAAVLAEMARLDAALWIVPLAVHAAGVVVTSVAGRGRGALRALRPSIVLGGSSLALELALFRWLGGAEGTWIPVSALWKRWWSRGGATPHGNWPTLAPGEALGELARQAGDLFGLAPLGPGGAMTILAAAVLALVVVEWRAAARDSSRRPRPGAESAAAASGRRVRHGLAVLGGAVVLHAAAVAVLADRPWPWYFVPLSVGLLVALAVLLGHLPRRDAGGPSPRRVAEVALAVACVASLAAAGGSARQEESTQALTTSRIRLARELAELVPPGARAAALNSGELAFFSTVPVTNLDGLANSAGFYRYRIAGGSLTAYLERRAIDYFVDYNVPAGIAARSCVVALRPIGDLRGAPAASGLLEVRRLAEPATAPE